MRYISDDGRRVFNTPQECCEYEQHVENQKNKREQLEKERKERRNAINEKYTELQELLSEYEKDYGLKQKLYFAPIYEFLDMLCG